MLFFTGRMVMSSQDHIDVGHTADNPIVTRQELENKSTEELFATTLSGQYDDEVAWEAVSVLRLRGTSEVFELAKSYCDSIDPKARARGLSVLAQLGAGKPDPERPFLGVSVSIAIDHLQDSDLEVVRCAAWALSHLGTKRGVAALINLRAHADPETRQAVACCIEVRQHPEGINVLLQLMEDSNEVVRDWATFSIGTEWMGNDAADYIDSPQIRSALRNRLEDPYEEARREAIWGLARRRDPEGLKLLLDELEFEECWSGDQDAAEEILGKEPGTSIDDLIQGLRALIPHAS
jgi:HEAT repeat protein